MAQAISIYTDGKQAVCITNEEIPLYKGRDINRILYISNAALQLAKSEKILALEIANAIASHISTNLNKEFQLQIVPPGWIHFELTHPFLATWLQGLADGGVGEQECRGVGEQGGRVFTAQYAHARCCSLLRLAHQEGLIQRTMPIPWLLGSRLRLNHPACWGLISKLVEVVDLEFSCPSGMTWEKATQGLAQAFLRFWSDCRIWGEVKTDLPELAQARLGLVMATQSVLRFLLEEKLGIIALEEL